MAQGSITGYYGKRKFAPDGEVHPNKVQLLDEPTKEGSETTFEAKSRRVVAKLTFDGDEAVQRTPPVPFKKLGALSPVKKDVSVTDIKKALSKSSRINELKTRLKSFNSNYAKLVETAKTPEKEKAALKQFSSIEIPVPVSPVKQASPFTSPIKQTSTSRSPFKSPNKVPAYERYASLTVATPSLTLPHHYRWLGEVFRAVDTACSLLHNRNETVTFIKLKPAAQEMLKRNVTEQHLAQIKHLSPNMYTFTREKIRSFGTTSKRDEYELVIVPNLVSGTTGSPVKSMTSNIVLERRRSFYNMLIEKVKDHHESFLSTLEPPMNISRTNLKSWHPQFDIERIPDIECDDLPPNPEIEKYSTAQDVLSKAREMFNNNPRIEKALRRIAEAKVKENQKNENGEGSQTTKPMTVVEAISEDITILNPALKNLPESLLQKVRARQAEKALQTMTRTIMQSENILLHQRLPELARIVRNVFLTEKKSVLPQETVLSKLDNSFASKLTCPQLINLLKSLGKEAPEWLTFCHIRKTDFIKLSKTANFTSVMSKLEVLANKHTN